jgi:hypothetical protein
MRDRAIDVNNLSVIDIRRIIYSKNIVQSFLTAFEVFFPCFTQITGKEWLENIPQPTLPMPGKPNVFEQLVSVWDTQMQQSFHVRRLRGIVVYTMQSM